MAEIEADKEWNLHQCSISYHLIALQTFLQRHRFNDDQFQNICDSLLIRMEYSFTNLFVMAYYSVSGFFFKQGHSKVKSKKDRLLQT